MTLSEKLSKFQRREDVLVYEVDNFLIHLNSGGKEGKEEDGVGEDDSADMEWLREKRRKELEMLLPVVEELEPILDDVNKGWLDGSGEIEGPYIRKGDEDYNYAFLGIDLKKKPEIEDGLSVRDNNGYFALRLRVDRYSMVRVMGADEKFVWGSVSVDDEDLREKVEEIVFKVVTETGACH